MNISEFELISQIKHNLVTAPVDIIRGIGEDCAVIKKDEEQVWLVTTDCLIEKVHFELKSFSFLEIGKKAMSVNMSDIAAMGGKPRYAFVTLGVPDHVSSGDIQDLYTGLQQVASEFSTAITGGDTSYSHKTFFISLTVIGVADHDKYKLRSKAEPGDGIYVSGTLGTSALGLRLIQKKKKDTNYIQAHKNPRPRLLLGKILASYPEVHAMIDVSDGLVQDLSHILKASKVSAEIDYQKIPCEDDFYDVCKSVKMKPDELLLGGGEDYQLLFTMDESVEDKVITELEQKRMKVTKIGKIFEKTQISKVSERLGRLRVLNEGQEMQIKKLGFDHFVNS